jgi:hypothetical protein
MTRTLELIAAERERLLAAGSDIIGPGKVALVTIAHDEFCGVFSDGDCTCEPDIKFEKAPS